MRGNFELQYAIENQNLIVKFQVIDKPVKCIIGREKNHHHEFWQRIRIQSFPDNRTPSDTTLSCQCCPDQHVQRKDDSTVNAVDVTVGSTTPSTKRVYIDTTVNKETNRHLYPSYNPVRDT